jgi:putative DNA primase/helicase
MVDPAQKTTSGAPVPVLDRANPLSTAREFLLNHYHDARGRLLFFSKSQFWAYGGKCWEVRSREDMIGEIHRFLSGCERIVGGRNVPFDPRSEDTERVCRSLHHEVNAPDALVMPTWGGAGNLDPKELVAFQYGIFNIRTKDRLSHTPLFWSPNVLDFDHDPQADCPRFTKLLCEDLFPNDLEAPWAVLEWIGYCLTDDTKYQKILLLIGPPRSGKGTLIRLMKAITGPGNFHSTSIHDFAGRFGLASAIGKKVIAIPEFVTDGVPPSVLSAMGTRLKSISGEDDVTVQRKNIDDWTGKLYAKLVLAANQTPRLRDLSGAVASRFIVIKFKNTFLGNEDYDLEEALRAERSGIFNLALRHWIRCGGAMARGSGDQYSPLVERRPRTNSNTSRAIFWRFLMSAVSLGQRSRCRWTGFSWNIDSGVFSKINATRGRRTTSPRRSVGSFHRLRCREFESPSSRRIRRLAMGRCLVF